MLVLPQDIQRTPHPFKTNSPYPFATHHNQDIDTNGTSNVGSICTTYADLVKQFGEPIIDGCDDGKVRAEWHLVIDGKAVCTIYDWKRSEPLEEVVLWNLGGHRGSRFNVQIAMANMLDYK